MELLYVVVSPIEYLLYEPPFPLLPTGFIKGIIEVFNADYLLIKVAYSFQANLLLFALTVFRGVPVLLNRTLYELFFAKGQGLSTP